jgi:hypothetical protein
MSTPNDRKVLLDAILAVDEKLCRQFVHDLYDAIISPAFGSLPKSELELLLFKGLKDLKVIPHNPNPYDLSAALRVKRSKATNLIYDSDLRDRTASEVLDLCRETLENAILTEDKQKKEMRLYVDNLRVQDEIKRILLAKKIPTNRTFDSAVLIVPIDGFAVLVNAFYPPQSRVNAEELCKSLAFKSKFELKDFVQGMLGAAAKTVAGKSGERITQELGDFVVDQIKQHLDPKSA